MTFGVTGGGLLPSDVEKERRVQYGEKDGKLGEWLTTSANLMTDGARGGSNGRGRGTEVMDLCRAPSRAD